MSFFVLRLSDMLKEVGEEFVNELFSDFSCPPNGDVEFFLKEKSILFQKMDISRTHLVFAEYKKEKVLVGYFALAIKVLPIRKGVSNTMRKKLTGTASHEVSSIAAILIGQLGKNFSHGHDQLISGEQLLFLALRKVLDVHEDIAGKIIFLECANEAKLVQFYESCGFKMYDVNPDGLLQFIRYTKDIDFQ